MLSFPSVLFHRNRNIRIFASSTIILRELFMLEKAYQENREASVTPRQRVFTLYISVPDSRENERDTERERRVRDVTKIKFHVHTIFFLFTVCQLFLSQRHKCMEIRDYEKENCFKSTPPPYFFRYFYCILYITMW